MEAQYLSAFPSLIADSYSELDDTAGTAPAALSQACANQGLYSAADLAGLPTVTVVINSTTISSAELMAQCGSDSICVLPTGVTLLMDASINVAALRVLSHAHVRWDTATQTATHQWLCAGYVAIEGSGSSFTLDLSEDGKKNAYIYIKDNGVTHSYLRTRAFGAVASDSPAYSGDLSNGPVITIKGKPIRRTWSVLAEPLLSGQNRLRLAHDPREMGWVEGDRIQVAPTAGQGGSAGIANTFRIASLGAFNVIHLAASFPSGGPSGSRDKIVPDGRASKTFGATFEYIQRQEPGRRVASVRSAEVIHLTRSVVLTGDDFRQIDCDPSLSAGGGGNNAGISDQGCLCKDGLRTKCTMGLHMAHMYGGSSHIFHMRIEKCGQQGVLGKYCSHLHLLGDSPSSVFEGNAVEYAHQRGYNIHGTHRSTFRFNVASDVRGANFYVEDGNEMWTNLEYNVAVCPYALNDPFKSGCTIPASPNGEADGANNQAGIWLTGAQNNLIGNRMSNSFNGMLCDVNFHARGGGPAKNKACVLSQRVGRWDGNTFHNHGRFGTYGLGNFFPKRDIGEAQTLDTNGELPGGSSQGGSICGRGFYETGEDNGWTHAIANSFDYGNAFVGHYGAGDLQYLDHVAIDALNLVYWKTSKTPADGCSGLLKGGYYRGGNLGLPDQGAFILEELVIDGRATLESNHHCDVGSTGVLCAPHYILHKVVRKDGVEGSEQGWLAGFNGQATVYVLSPPECAANAARSPKEAFDAGVFFPAGFCSLTHQRYTYLLEPGLFGKANASNISATAPTKANPNEPQYYYVTHGGNQIATDEKCMDVKATRGSVGNIAVQCCSDNLESSQEGGVARGSRPGCQDGDPWAVAKALCEDQGNRLCTLDEVQVQGAGKGSGCNFDSQHVWTSTNCSAAAASASGGSASNNNNDDDDASQSLMGNAMCTSSLALKDGQIYGKVGKAASGRYGKGILCRVPLRVLKIFTHSMVAKANDKSTNVAPQLRVEVWRDDSLPADPKTYVRKADVETFLTFHAIGDTPTNGAQRKQGYSVPVVPFLGNDHATTMTFGVFRYRLSLANDVDDANADANAARGNIPEDWIIEFSDPIFSNRWVQEENVMLDLVGRDCAAAGVSNMHDRKFMSADDGGIYQTLAKDGAARIRGACRSGLPKMPRVDCSARTRQTTLSATECPGECGAACDAAYDRAYCACGSKVCKCRPGFSETLTTSGGGSAQELWRNRSSNATATNAASRHRTAEDICPVDICGAARCGDHGVCSARFFGGDLPVSQQACVCEPPWFGPLCDQNPCSSESPGFRNCSGHGQCVPAGGGANQTTCSCHNGYTGDACDVSCDGYCQGSGGKYPYGCAALAAADTFALLCGKSGGCSYPDTKAGMLQGVSGGMCAYFSRDNGDVEIPRCLSENDCKENARYDCVAGECPPGGGPHRPDGSPCNSKSWGTCLHGECVAGLAHTSTNTQVGGGGGGDGSGSGGGDSNRGATSSSGSGSGSGGTATAAAAVTIGNVGNTFTPRSTTVNVGDTVMWDVDGVHNVVQTHGDACTPKSGGFSTPYGGGRHTFTSAGTFFYKCDPHCLSSGMRGRIVVVPRDGRNGSSPSPASGDGGSDDIDGLGQTSNGLHNSLALGLGMGAGAFVVICTVAVEVVWRRGRRQSEKQTTDSAEADNVSLRNRNPTSNAGASAEEWESEIDPETGREYYYNENRTTWTRPVGMRPAGVIELSSVSCGGEGGDGGDSRMLPMSTNPMTVTR
jgi:plastocyanin